MKRFLEIISIAFIFICFITIVQSCKKLTLPVVTTLNVTGFTATSAESGGNVINNGGAEVIARGVCWSTSKEPTINSNPNLTSNGSGNGAFTSNITGLTANTLYYVRAYATNSEGTGYGDIKNFTTHCDSPSAPVVGTITQPTCSATTGSVVFSGLPAAGTWTLTRTPGGTTTTGTGTSTTVSGLPAGTTYTFTVTNASRCVSAASDNIVINTQPATSSAPVVGTTTQPTCAVATGSVALSGLPSTGTWTLTRTPGGTTYSQTGTSYTVTGLPAGTTYTFTVTNASGCVSAASGNVVINTQAATPSAPVVGTTTQPTCAVATGSVALSGLPTTGTWTLKRTPGGTTYSQTGTSYTVTGLPGGTTYTFTVTNTSGCISTASANVVINAQPATPTAPSVGTITQPTCSIATGSVVLNGLPDGNWTINPGSITGSGSNTTISSLTAGTYNYMVTNASGCVSGASGNVVISTRPASPSTPVVGTITQPTCTVATGSVILSGLPSAETWTLTRTPGGTTTSGSGTNKTVSGLPSGTTYTFTVTNSSGCVSVASGSVVIGAQPVAPSASTGYFNASYNEAIIGGTVNAHNASTTVTIQYGPTTSYGSEITATQSPVTGSSDTHVSATITGLNPDTRYYFRVKAVNNCGGPIYGNQSDFTTPLCPVYITRNHTTSGNVAPVAETVTYSIVKTNLTGTYKCWITRNLGASNQASSATDGSEAAAGWYWQFNRKQGYKHDGTARTPNTTWITPIDENSNWIAENDPCANLLGIGWRIPAYSEWYNVDNNGGWNNYNDAFTSDLKLHNAGVLFNSDGTLINRSAVGSYWSNIQYSTAYGWFFSFSDSFSGTLRSVKQGGFSIRCLID